MVSSSWKIAYLSFLSHYKIK